MIIEKSHFVSVQLVNDEIIAFENIFKKLKAEIEKTGFKKAYSYKEQEVIILTCEHLQSANEQLKQMEKQ